MQPEGNHSQRVPLSGVFLFLFDGFGHGEFIDFSGNSCNWPWLDGFALSSLGWVASAGRWMDKVLKPGGMCFFPIPSGRQGFWDGSFSNLGGGVVSRKLGDHQCMSGHQGSRNYAFFGGIRHLQQCKLDVWHVFSLIVHCLGWCHIKTPWMCQGFYSASARSS